MSKVFAFATLILLGAIVTLVVFSLIALFGEPDKAKEENRPVEIPASSKNYLLLAGIPTVLSLFTIFKTIF